MKFWVSGIVTITFTEIVEAETVEEAEKKVAETAAISLQWDSEEIEITDSGEVPTDGAPPS